MLAQKFTPISEDQALLSVQSSDVLKNAVVMGNKIYYTTPQGNATDKFNLVVANLDGSNVKILSTVVISGTHCLVATDHFIYFGSYVEQAKYYHLFRYDPTNDKLEAVVGEGSGAPWPFSGTQVSMARMYAQGDKLVLAGTFRLTAFADFRTLAIIEDERPVANILYLDEMPNTRDYRRLELMYNPAHNDIALTDSSVYVYSQRSETKKKMLYIYSTKKGSADKKYAVETVVDFNQFGYTPLHHQLVTMNGEVYTLVFKNDRPKDSKTVSLVRFTNKHIGNDIAIVELKEDGLFMEAFGKELYFGNKYNIYHYNVLHGAQLIATTKGNGYFALLQSEKRLLRAENGTLFLSHKKCYGQTTKTNKTGAAKIIAVDATFRTDSICTIENMDCNNYFDEMPHDSCFVVGNTFYILNHDDKTDWFVTYDRKNNWAATRLDYPEVKDYKKYYATAPTMQSLPNRVLIRAEYRKSKKQKKELTLQLQPLRPGEVAPSPPVNKIPNGKQNLLKQVIKDTAFAAAIRAQCPECINAENKLFASAQTLAKLELNSKSIYDLTGIEAFTDLRILYCGSNKIAKIAALPKNLEQLYCFGNPLGSLPPLPPTLRILSCATTKLTALPVLPNGLTVLNCSVNQLTALPTLPNTLQELSCNENMLTTLPPLPNTLTSLYCQENQLQTLPTLPNALTQLACSQNRLTTLPTLPPTLESLICRDNQLTQLPTLPKTLQSLFIDNKIACLPNLVEGLEVSDSNGRSLKKAICK
jgi:hypothetical protein